MSAQQPVLKSELKQLLPWLVCLPSLMLWPFLSVLPFFTLMNGSSSALGIAINLILLATGFWPAIVLSVGYKLFRNLWDRGDGGRPNGNIGLLLGVCATGWTVMYLIVALASR